MTPDPIDPARRAYMRQTQLNAERQARILGRLDPHLRSTGPTRRPARWVGGLALAAAALCALAWFGLPPPRADPVALGLDGEGTVGGTETAPVIAWQSGTVSVSVDPDAGVDLTVETDEATVEVVGTVFRVHRAHYATDVAVTRGAVAVTCVGRPPVTLAAGSTVTCLPADLAPLLRRVTSLARAKASPQARIEAIDRADALSDPGSATTAELLAHRAKALAESGDEASAIAAARAYLDSGDLGRRAEILAFVARTTYDREGCSAVDDLERAVAAIAGGPEALLLASCLIQDDPDRAKALLDAATPTATGEWREVAERLDSALEARP